MHLQNLANQLPNSFSDLKRVIKSYVPTVNVPPQIDILKLKGVSVTSKTHLKPDRPMGSKDKKYSKKEKEHKR